MSSAGYAYLLWNDYVDKGGISPEEALSDAKTKIMSRFGELIEMNPVLQKPKELIKDAYSLSDEEFRKNVERSLMDFRNNEYGTLLQSVDNHNNSLKKLIEETNSVQACYVELNSLIKTLDNIINQGQKGGTITAESVKIIKRVRDKAELLSTKFQAQSKGRSKVIKEDDLKILKEIQKDLVSNVAGYTLEIFLTLSQMTVQFYGDKKINDDIRDSILNTGAKIEEDSLRKVYLDQIQKEIQELGTPQTKADTVRFFQTNLDNGTAEGHLTIISETAQAKNFTDLSKVSLGDHFTEHTLSNLNFQGDDIFNYFPEEYLINAASALGSNIDEGKTSPELMKILKEQGQKGKTQKELVENWNDIVKNISVLSAIDALVGKDILSSAEYYVIRSKTSGQVKVISSADIITKIALDPMRILRFEGLNNGSINKRYTMSDINKNEFIKDKDRKEARLERSTIVWNKVKGIIQNTKIKIAAINVKSWFD